MPALEGGSEEQSSPEPDAHIPPVDHEDDDDYEQLKNNIWSSSHNQ